MAHAPITVVTTTYNYPEALRLAIKSALEQDEADFEYLIIGDCCTDETEEMVRSIGDPRIQWHNLPENLGNQADVNRLALEMANGRLIAYLNHDDLWYREHLSTLRSCIEDGGFDIAASLALGISPPPHLHREVIGLPRMVGPDRKFRVHSMTSSVMHTSESAKAAGSWKRWRESELVPTSEFFHRLRATSGNHAVVPLITSLKFHSADRRDSYRLKDASEQEHWYEKMLMDDGLRHRELAAALMFRMMQIKTPKLKQQTRPEDAPAGWEIEQYRRLRGLEPDLAFGPVDDDLGEAAAIDYRAHGIVRRGETDSLWLVDPVIGEAAMSNLESL